MNKSTPSSIHIEHPLEPWGLSGRLSFFYDRLRKLTTTSPLSLAQILNELRRISTSDGILLLSRSVDPVVGNIHAWGVCAYASASNENQQIESLITLIKEKKSVWRMLDFIVAQARSCGGLEAKAEFTPSWLSRPKTANEKKAIEEIRKVEKEHGLDLLESEVPKLGLVCGLALGYVMLGKWWLGETMIVMVRLKKSLDALGIIYFEDIEECLIEFLIYLGETNSHIVKKHNLERLPFAECRRYLRDEKCGAAYVRSICRLAPLWEEHPEVGLESYPGRTIECLAVIEKNHGSKKEVFTPGFTIEDAILELEKVRKALGNK